LTAFIPHRVSSMIKDKEISAKILIAILNWLLLASFTVLCLGFFVDSWYQSTSSEIGLFRTCEANVCPDITKQIIPISISLQSIGLVFGLQNIGCAIVLLAGQYGKPFRLQTYIPAINSVLTVLAALFTFSGWLVAKNMGSALSSAYKPGWSFTLLIASFVIYLLACLVNMTSYVIGSKPLKINAEHSCGSDCDCQKIVKSSG
jgi:hypothetical protein